MPVSHSPSLLSKAVGNNRELTFLPDRALALTLQVLSFEWLTPRMYKTGAQGQNYLIRQSGTLPGPWGWAPGSPWQHIAE